MERIRNNGKRAGFTYIALVFEWARLREAVKAFWADREEELVALRVMQGGVGRWCQVDRLRNDEAWKCRTFSSG